MIAKDKKKSEKNKTNRILQRFLNIDVICFFHYYSCFFSLKKVVSLHPIINLK